VLGLIFAPCGLGPNPLNAVRRGNHEQRKVRGSAALNNTECNRKARTGPGLSNVSLALNLNDGEVMISRTVSDGNTDKSLAPKDSCKK